MHSLRAMSHRNRHVADPAGKVVLLISLLRPRCRDTGDYSAEGKPGAHRQRLRHRTVQRVSAATRMQLYYLFLIISTLFPRLILFSADVDCTEYW